MAVVRQVKIVVLEAVLVVLEQAQVIAFLLKHILLQLALAADGIQRHHNQVVTQHLTL